VASENKKSVALRRARQTSASERQSNLQADDSSRATREIKEDAASRNTDRSARTAKVYWSTWYQLRYPRSVWRMPVAPRVVKQFVVDHGQRRSRDKPGLLRHELPLEIDRQLVEFNVKQKLGPLQLATILQRVSMLGHLHRTEGLPTPLSDPGVRDLLADLRRAYGKRDDDAPAQRPALTAEPLEKLIELCEDDIETGDLWTRRRALRNRAMLFFAFATGGRRRSEVTSATVQRLKKHPNGDYYYTMGATKTDRANARRSGKIKALKDRPAEAMTEWLKEAGLRSGPIFRRIARGGQVMNEALTPATVRNVVRALAKRADLEDGYSAHSLRSGFMTEAATQGIALPEAMKLSEHKSVQSAMRYYDVKDVLDSPAASLIDSAPRPQKKRRK
jgi:integrase